METNGLITVTESGEYSVNDEYTDGGGASTTGAAGGPPSSGQPAAQVSTSTAASTTTAGGVNSHLDSWFDTHAMTREDVLVLAAIIQLVGWVALLYIEVQR